MHRTLRTALWALAALAPAEAWAQRAGENAVAQASDGFGAQVGNERVGVYSASSVRGFNPGTAGNRRLEGLYFEFGGNGGTNRLVARTTVRVGLPALAYPFPAPSGIVDFSLRTAGPEAVLSLVAQRPAYGGYSLEIDGQAPLADGRLRVGAGVGAASNTYVDGRETRARSAAVLPTLRLEGSEWTGFYGYSQTGGDVPAILTTVGARLPPQVDTSRFYGQSWIDNEQVSHTYGGLGRVDVADDLTLRLGAFESRSVRRRTYTDLFLNVQPDGTASSVVVSDPRLPARWTSGEARLSWNFEVAGFDQALHASVRGRDKRLELGGSAQAALGPSRVGVLTPALEPVFRHGAPMVNRVQQLSGGVAWIGRWRGLEANLGLQKTDYSSETTRNGRTARTTDKPWLYNATLAWAPTDWLGLYGGLTRGLEESAPPPASAANRDDAVPASRTRQADAGVRIAWQELRLVAGVFEIERPYYSVGADNLYRPLGEVRNRGVEVSLAGPLTDRLSVVAGLVLMDPRVTGEAFDAGRVGKRPVNSTTRSARLDLEYKVPVVDGLSLSLAVQHTGDLVASTSGFAALDGDQLEVPAATTVDLGVRYRFKAGETPVTLRAQVLNLFDVRRPTVVASNTFTSADSRRVTFQLAADF